MINETVMDIIAYGAWNGGRLIDNSVFENKGMFFKGNVPVNNETIEKRIGIRTRVAAPADQRIGMLALGDLLSTSDFDPTRVKVLIGATNVGDEKDDPSPLVRHAFKLLQNQCPNAMVFDLYAGCPGFNAATEVLFVLSLAGVLNQGDISIIIGAENIHRAKAFRPLDTSNIIFGDDAMATAFETKTNLKPQGQYHHSERCKIHIKDDLISELAQGVLNACGKHRFDGIIVDNQLGKLFYRVPATAARIQHAVIEKKYPDEALNHTFSRFKDAIRFYDQQVQSFAFDINTLGKAHRLVEDIARAYVQSGIYHNIVSIYLTPHHRAELMLHSGGNYRFVKPKYGIMDTFTQTHGCFGDYIQAIIEEGDIFGEIDGKGVFLYATRGAKRHIEQLLHRNHFSIDDIELLIEHQANFAMIPLTLQRLLTANAGEKNNAVGDFISNKMVNNIHYRGNCSVVCMQRLPYDLQRGVLEEDTIHGFPVNRNVKNLRKARLVLYDSVGAGMTRSSFLYRKPLD